MRSVVHGWLGRVHVRGSVYRGNFVFPGLGIGPERADGFSGLSLRLLGAGVRSVDFVLELRQLLQRTKPLPSIGKARVSNVQMQ